MASGVYWITDGGYQTGFVVGEDSVIAIDAPPSIGGANVLKAIRDVTHEPISHVIYTQYHGDHIGDADVYGSDVVRIGQAETAGYLRRFADSKRPPLDQTFEERLRLDVAGQTIDLIYRGPITHRATSSCTCPSPRC